MQTDLHAGNVFWINYEKTLLPEITELFSECPCTSKDSGNKTDRSIVEAITTNWQVAALIPREAAGLFNRLNP
jgi:hypothetical protein